MSVLQNLRRRSSAKSIKRSSSTAPPTLEDKADKSGSKARFSRLRKKSFSGLVIPSQGTSSSSSLLPSPLFASPLPSPGLEISEALSAPEAKLDAVETGDDTLHLGSLGSPILLASPILLESSDDGAEETTPPRTETRPDLQVHASDMTSAEKRASLLASLAAALSPTESTPVLSALELPGHDRPFDDDIDLQEIALRELTLDAAVSSLVEEESEASPQISSLSKTQSSRQSRAAPEASNTSEESSADDYGSASDKEGLGVGSEKESGDDGGDGPGRNPPNDRPSVPADHIKEIESDSDDSDDEYGSDKGLDREASADRAIESDSSEDVPLGDKVSDAERLQAKLKRRMLREQALRLKAARAHAKKTADASRSTSVTVAKQGPTSRSTSVSQQQQTGLAQNSLAPTPRAASLNASDLTTRLKSLQETGGRNIASSAHPDPSGRPGDLLPGTRAITAQTLSRHASLVRQQASLNRSAADSPLTHGHTSTAEITRKLDSTVLRSQSLRGRVPSGRPGAPPVPAVPRHLAQVIGSPETLLQSIPSASRDSSSEIGIPESRASLNLARTEAPPTAAQDTAATPSTVTSVAVVPYRIFIITKQRYVNVEIRQDARARDLVVEVMSKGSVFNDESTPGGWVIFDVSATLGIERPLREYELVSEVAENRASQSADYFLLRRTELATYLSIRSVPTSSPALAGYVYLLDRKKKWNKRWLELRDHSLFHGKSDKGKDQELLCHTSSFDVYIVQPAALKAPKAHAFALRSQDSITLFEKPDQDYVHFLSLSDPAAHRDWVKNIINARTYVLKQERAALFRMPAPGPASSDNSAVAESNLSRSNTKSSSRNVSQPSPLIPASAIAASSPRPQPLIGADAFRGPFEKGSLLADVALKGVGINSVSKTAKQP